MSNETVGIIKKHISDTLGVELIRTYDKRANGAAFNVHLEGNTIRIFILEAFVSFIEQVNDTNSALEQLDVLNFIKSHPGKNLFLGLNGITIDSINS